MLLQHHVALASCAEVLWHLVVLVHAPGNFQLNIKMHFFVGLDIFPTSTRAPVSLTLSTYPSLQQK